MVKFLYKLLIQTLAGFAVGGCGYLLFEDTLKPMSESQRMHVLALYVICALFAWLSALSATRSAEARVRNIYPLADMPKIKPVVFHWVMAVISAWVIIIGDTDVKHSPHLLDMQLVDFSILGIFFQPFTFVIACVGWVITYGNRYSLPAFDAFVARTKHPFDNFYD